MTQSPPSPPSRPTSAPSAPGEAMMVQFEHPFFKRVEDVHFRLDERTDEPTAMVKLGDEQFALKLDSLRREFSLTEDTPDGRMLSLVIRGLKYVRGLRPGDTLPSEIFTRRASWEPQKRHQQIAYHRLALQLMGWLSGDEHIITDPEELLQVAGDPTFRRKINDAFAEAAEALGLGRENRDQVTHYIADLAHELSYIEALRDQYMHMRRMDEKIQGFRRLYGAERTILQAVDSVARLMERAVAEFGALFDQVDAQTGEIMAALRNIDSQKTFIQDARDDLHARLMAWEELLAAWTEQPLKKSTHAEDLITETYRFLAPRFMPVDEWTMMTRLQQTPVVSPTGKRVEQKKVKRLGGSMEWT